MSPENVWYVDSSVILRALIEKSPAARIWFEEVVDAGDTLVASRLLEVEVRRVSLKAKVDQDIVSEYLDEFDYLSVDDDLMDEAISLAPPLSGADAIHIASAERIGPDFVVLVTHDLEMAEAGRALGYTVFDPVIDDPNRGPVA